MEDENSQIKTALLAPFMSCSAKLPIYLVLGAAFFGAKNIFVVFILYLIGIFVSVLVALLLEAKPLKSKRQSFILEFPDYRVPSLKKILKLVWKNFASFVTRVGGVLVFVNIIVWFLQSFSFSFHYVPTDGGRSILESLGKVLAPVFIPLGFGNWGAVSALLAGVVAKEVVVSSIAIFNGMSGASSNQTISMTLLDPLSPVHFTPASCFSFLVFCLLYCPCLSSMVVLKKEVGRKWMWLALVIQLVSAYVFAFVFYTLFLVFTKVAKWKIITVACVILIAISFVVVLVKSKKKKTVSSRVSSTAAAASSSASSPAAAPAPAKVQKAAAQPKEKPPKTTAVLQERPDASFVVFGVVALAGAVFLFASSHVIFSVVAALFGIFCLYNFIHIKRHPEDPRYITEEQLTRWGQLVHSDANTVSQLQKASVPVLVDLKKRAAWHYEQVSSVGFGPDVSYYGQALIDVQNQIVALSEFVMLQGDNPKQDLENYSSFVSQKITAFTDDILKD